MLKLWMMLTCILFLGSIGTSQAAPLDSSDIVYIDGLPCNRACQSYMAWFRRASTPRQTAPVSEQLTPPQLAEEPPKAEAQRTTKKRENRPKSAPPIRVAKQAAPKPVEVPSAKVEVPSAKIGDLQPADRGEAKSATPEKISATPEKIVDSPPVSNPTSGSDADTKPEQVATAPAAENPTIATASPAPAPEQKADSNPKLPGAAEAIPPADVETTALASPRIDDQLVAILMVRLEIKSVSDLANKIVAIDVKRSDSVPSVRTAIAAAGAADVQISEGETPALTRVMDGEVPAAVVTLASPEDAEMWSAGMPGFKILRIPLSPLSEKARRG
jgi:hypothetical protein